MFTIYYIGGSKDGEKTVFAGKRIKSMIVPVAKDGKWDGSIESYSLMKVGVHPESGDDICVAVFEECFIGYDNE